MTIEFIDLKAQRQLINEKVADGINRVLEHGRFIMGPEVSEFQEKLAAFAGAKHALGCANGTDAILLPLMAWGIGSGDAVFCPSFTYCATAEVIALSGATPVFVDIDRDTYNLDAESLARAIADIKATGGLVPKVVIAVDLFGQPADYNKIAPIVRQAGLKLIADSAQGFGCTLHEKHPLHWADVATTSFFPAKPLGCYGDGGAVLTNDNDLAAAIDSIRIHGKGVDKYDNIRIGLNSRLDTLQAAILLPKLEIFPDEIVKRNVIAKRYSEGLVCNSIKVPNVIDGAISTWAQYTIEVDDWSGLAAVLKEQGVPTARYYPKPVHHQTAYNHFPCSGGELRNTEQSCKKVISLPMHPYLEENVQDMIVDTICNFVLENE